ncbi:MAG: IS4 family transposase, partial [Caldilineales bacterium]|nr:IS4 family transposase [Caldilineales bacterium]
MSQNKKRNPDHVRGRQRPSENNEAIEERLQELLTPAVQSQLSYYRSLGMRSRILSLPLMVAAVLTLLWRQVPSVHELSRMLVREDLLWCTAVKVSQQALSQRFLSFPAELFERVYKDVLPTMKERWEQRQQRPLPLSIQVANAHFAHIWIADGSTLEALFRKLEALQEAGPSQLAGKMCMVIDLVRQLPVELWFSEQAQAFDTNFIPNLLALVKGKTLLILDRGFYDFQFFAALMAQGSDFITRVKSNSRIEIIRHLSSTDSVKDMIVQLGTGQNGAPILTVRMVEVRFGSTWYRYIASVLDPAILPPFVVADLYRRRWRIEDAFNTAKRLLNLSYLWTGSVNGIQLQIWATWLFYAVLVDLGDAVADAMTIPFDRISLEMLFRGLYHFAHAFSKGKASDPVVYFSA